MFTDEDRLKSLWAPAARAIRSPESYERDTALAHALSSDGFVYPEALRLFGAYIPGGAKNSTVRNTSSTSAWTTHCVAVLNVGAGTWTIRATGDVRCNHSAGDTVDTRLLLNGQEIDVSSASAPSSTPAPFFLFTLIGGLPGNAQHTIELQFKSGATGTTTAGIARVVADALRMT